jgi:hypothetical protein
VAAASYLLPIDVAMKSRCAFTGSSSLVTHHTVLVTGQPAAHGAELAPVLRAVWCRWKIVMCLEGTGTARAHVGLEYACTNGHRFVAAAPDKPVRLTELGFVKVGFGVLC